MPVYANSTSWCTDDTATCINQSKAYYDTSGKQDYYNWYTATAGTGTYSTADGVQASSSICPKGWGLPSQSSSYVGDFSNLRNKYTYEQLLDKNGPAFTLSGYKASTSIVSLGKNGEYWSNLGYVWSYSGTTYRQTRHLNLLSSNSSVSVSSTARYYGLPVRCVLK